jgi:hypothetical protein
MGSILTKAKGLATDGILSARDVGKVLSKALEDGEISRAEQSDLKKVVDTMDDKLSPAARKALNEFLALGNTFDGNLASQLFGVSDADADKLEKEGIKSSTDLLAHARTHEQRLQIAGAAGVDIVVVTSLAEQADLARVLGIGRTYAALLQGVGINNVDDLSQQNAVNLRRSIGNFLKTSEGQAIGKRRPSLNSVKSWIANAKALPKLIREMGDAGASFDVEAFNLLSNDKKAMLLRGASVYLEDGSVFPASDLKKDVPRRKPRKLTDMINLLTSTNFNADYDYAQLSAVERIKLGDETIGYVTTFDVRFVEEMDAEGYGYDMPMEGYAEVVFDKDVNQLALHTDSWEGDYEV